VCFVRIWKKRRSFPRTLLTSFCNRYGVFAMRYNLNLYIYFRLVFVFKEAIPWLRRWVASLSPRRPRFEVRSVPLLFVVDKVALGQGFLRVLRLSLVNIIPLVLRTHLYLYAALPWQTGEVWEPSKKNSGLLENRGALDRKVN